MGAFLSGQSQKGFAVGAFLVNMGFAVPPFVFLPSAKASDAFGHFQIFLIFQLSFIDISGEGSEKVDDYQNQPNQVEQRQLCEDVGNE